MDHRRADVDGVADRHRFYHCDWLLPLVNGRGLARGQSPTPPIMSKRAVEAEHLITKSVFRVVTANLATDRKSWIYRNGVKFSGPYLTRAAALATVNALEAVENKSRE